MISGKKEIKEELFEEIKSQVQIFPRALAAIASTSIVFATSYELSFFFAIDFTFFSILTANDIVRRAVAWIPFFGLLFIGSLYVNINPDYLDPENPYAPSAFSFLALSMLSISGGIIYAIINPLDMDSSLFPLLVGLFFLMAHISRKWHRRISPTVVVYAFLSFAILYSFSKGLTDAYRSLTPPFDTFAIRTTSITDSRLANVVRVLEKGVLFSIPNRGLEFSPWDDVKELRKPVTPAPPRGIMQWFADRSKRVDLDYP